ncbi:Hypothetical protein SSCIU_00891 [Mammaliicoccus sciuri]|nr:Hypothetical protein SSCIU_00891 [Mammaliicoccus sciuri]
MSLSLLLPIVIMLAIIIVGYIFIKLFMD